MTDGEGEGDKPAEGGGDAPSEDKPAEGGGDAPSEGGGDSEKTD